MNINPRKSVFWTLDHLRGGKIRRNLNDVAELMADNQKANEFRERRFKELVEDVCKHVPYYKKFTGAESLREFRILEKQELREKYGEFISRNPLYGKPIPVTTSGSTGTPFTFRLSMEKRARQRAEVIYFNGLAGYVVGKRHAFVSGYGVKVKSRLKRFLQNEVFIRPVYINESWLAAERKKLLRNKVGIIIAYTSTIELIASYCLNFKDDPKAYGIDSIIVTAEPLTEKARKTIESAFACRVFSRYSTVELGVIAQECQVCKMHHINTASHIVEIVKMHEDRPAEIGEMGRILVTDLFSNAMPLIRYNTGDISVKAGSRGCSISGEVIGEIQGRVLDVIDTPDGEPISPYMIAGMFRDIDNIVQFQFVQTGREKYVVYLHITPGFNGSTEILKRMSILLGSDAVVKIEHVDQIAPLSSGKRLSVKNEWKRGNQ